MAKAKSEIGLPRTLEEFDRWHAQQPERWEFFAGEPVMMAPARNPHSIIKSNIGGALYGKLRPGPCRAMVGGPEIRTKDFSAIPDVVVTCSPIDPTTGRIDLHIVIVEVNSPSSEGDDSGRRWNGYCLIESLRHYLVVDSATRFATLHTRVAAFEWTERVFQDGSIALDALDVSLTFEEIYEGVAFTPAADA